MFKRTCTIDAWAFKGTATGYIFHVRKLRKCTDFTYYNVPRSLRLLVATARSSRYTRVATAYNPHAILE